MKGEDILSLRPMGLEQTISVLVFDLRGHLRPELLGLEATDVIAAEDFDSAALLGWIAGCGGDVPQSFVTKTYSIDDLLVLQARGECSVWLVQACNSARLMQHPSPGVIEFALKPATSGAGTPLPQASGLLREEFTVKRGTAVAYELKAGEAVQIIDFEG